MADIILPKCEFITDESGKIVKVRSESKAIEVIWNNTSESLIKYANFVISEVCNNRGIE